MSAVDSLETLAVPARWPLSSTRTWLLKSRPCPSVAAPRMLIEVWPGVHSLMKPTAFSFNSSVTERAVDLAILSWWMTCTVPTSRLIGSGRPVAVMKPSGRKYCCWPGWSIGLSCGPCCWSCAWTGDCQTATDIKVTMPNAACFFIVVPTQERQIFSEYRGGTPPPGASPAGRDAPSIVRDDRPTRPSPGDRRDRPRVLRGRARPR